MTVISRANECSLSRKKKRLHTQPLGVSVESSGIQLPEKPGASALGDKTIIFSLACELNRCQNLWNVVACFPGQ